MQQVREMGPKSRSLLAFPGLEIMFMSSCFLCVGNSSRPALVDVLKEVTDGIVLNVSDFFIDTIGSWGYIAGEFADSSKISGLVKGAFMSG